MAELPAASEKIVQGYFALPTDQRGAFIGEVNLTGLELAEILSRETPRDLAMWERATRPGAVDADSDFAAMVHGLVIRILRGDDPHEAIAELSEAIPDCYENEGTGELEHDQ